MFVFLAAKSDVLFGYAENLRSASGVGEVEFSFTASEIPRFMSSSGSNTQPPSFRSLSCGESYELRDAAAERHAGRLHCTVKVTKVQQGNSHRKALWSLVCLMKKKLRLSD